MSIFSYLLRVLILTPVYYVMYISIDNNPDINAYMYSYEGESWNYDIGYELYSQAVKYIFDLSFIEYWNLTLIVQVLILAFIYNRVLFLIIAIPNLLYLAEPLFGTQIRYSMSLLLFLLLLSRGDILASKNIIYRFISHLMIISMHYSAIILCSIREFVLGSAKRKGEFKNLVLFMVSMYVALSILPVIISYTRFKYYLGSEFFESKSLVSTLYALLLLLFHFYFIFIRKIKFDIVLLSTYILVAVVAFSPIAVLSGRILIFYHMLEPFIVWKLFSMHDASSYLMGYLFLILTLSKFIPWFLGAI